MKQKLKQFTKFMAVCALLVLGSCEKDLYEDTLQPKKEGKMKKVSLKDLSKTENQNLFAKIAQIKIKGKNELGKIVYDSINDFYFDDENGVEIVGENGEKSFTFPIYSKDGDQKIENLLFEKNILEQYEVYKVKYNFTYQELKLFSQQQLATQEIIYISLDTGKQQILCVDTWTFNPLYTPCTQTHANGETCTDVGAWSVESNCQNVADNSGTGVGNSSSTGWGNGTFGNTGTTNNSGGTIIGGGLHTSPVTTPGLAFINSLGFTTENILGLYNETQQVIFDYLTATNFNNQGTVKFALQHIDNYEYLHNQSVETQVNIFSYLAQNNFSSQSVSFVNQMINLCIVNNSTFTLDSSVTAQNAQVFSNVAEFQDYITSSSIQMGIESYENPTNNNGHKAYFRFKLTNMKGVTVIADVVSNPNGTSTVSSATSIESGLYVMSQWDQNGDASITTLPNGNIKIIIVGTIKSNAVLQTVGLSFSTTYELTMVYNPNNGILISSSSIKIN